MLHLLSLLFQFVGGIVHSVLGFIGSILGLVGRLVGTVFSLLGGIVGLTLRLMAVGLIIGLIVEVCRRRKNRDACSADDEEFTSFYSRR